MRTINVDTITETVSRLCIQANRKLPDSLEKRISFCGGIEQSPAGKAVFNDLYDNIQAAKDCDIAICQDTGMAIIFLEIGQDVHFEGGSLYDAVNHGVADGYTKGFLRCSIVGDPLQRVNTGNNTPAIIHTKITDGDKVKIDVCPKGFGSENMSSLKMFTPAASENDIVDYVTDVISRAGSNPCPPIVVGVGIGGSFEYCAYLAKKALCRDISIRNPNTIYADLENRMLDKINLLGIGPQGFGGTITALAVNIEQHPTHIAGLPVAVNVGCHVTRHASAEI